MAAKKETTETRVRAAALTRGSRGKSREGAFFPVSPPRAGLPRDYAETLKYMRTFAAVWPERKIVQRVVAQRIRTSEHAAPVVGAMAVAVQPGEPSVC